MLKIILYILIGYLIYQLIRFVITANRVIKNGQAGMNSGARKEKDISKVAKILDEKRPGRSQKSKH